MFAFLTTGCKNRHHELQTNVTNCVIHLYSILKIFDLEVLAQSEMSICRNQRAPKNKQTKNIT